MDQLIKQRIVSLSATRGAGSFLSQIDFSRFLPYFVEEGGNGAAVFGRGSPVSSFFCNGGWGGGKKKIVIFSHIRYGWNRSAADISHTYVLLYCIILHGMLFPQICRITRHQTLKKFFFRRNK